MRSVWTPRGAERQRGDEGSRSGASDRRRERSASGDAFADGERLARSRSCGDFLSASETGEMGSFARRDTLRRLATESALDADARARRRPRRARRIKKRFTLRPAERDALRSRLRPGKNVVAFSFASSLWGKQTVMAHRYLWSWQAKIVISDVDGTITKSDVIGHLAPMVGKDWNHAGIASLYNRIRDNGFELMFLSSRAVSQSAGTRRYLEKLTQDGETLTHGPVLLAPDSISAALYREVVIRQPQVFKMGCLNAIRALFPSAAEKEDASSEACNESPFYAGFGNRETDAASYASVGVPPGRIFTINPKSEVVAETTKATRRWDLAEMIAMANEMFPPEAAGGGAGWEDDACFGDGSLIGGVLIDDAFIDSNYWGRGSMDTEGRGVAVKTGAIPSEVQYRIKKKSVVTHEEKEILLIQSHDFAVSLSLGLRRALTHTSSARAPLPRGSFSPSRCRARAIARATLPARPWVLCFRAGTRPRRRRPPSGGGPTPSAVKTSRP